MKQPQINLQRLLQRLSAFAEIGATAAGGVNRQALSEEDRTARRLLADLARARGFAVYQDEAANLFIRRAGTNPNLPPVMIGSHLDSQPTGGKFDGALGTLSALEVLEALEDAGVETLHPLEVVSWTNEEGSRFSPGCMGSMAFVGKSRVADWTTIKGADGVALIEALQATLEALPGAATQPPGHDLAAYLELHIEQGPVLERQNVPIGVVTGVQGTKWLEICFSGVAAHAGTTPLAYRKDPMAAAIQAIARLQHDVMPADPMARLTVGRIAAEPGSINVIPGKARFMIDIRHPDAAKLAAIEALIGDTCREAAGQEKCSVTIETRFNMPPGQFDPRVIAAVETACARLDLPSLPMVSGAFHDALFLSQVTPSAMIFVPCKDGISHNEAEHVSDADVQTGAAVLMEATIALSAMSSMQP